MLRICCGFILSVISVWAYAASDAQEYQVEVLLFEQPASTQTLLERWPQHPATPNLQQAHPMVSEPELGLTRLEPSAFRLKHEAKRLRSSGYRLLWHGAWRQPLRWQVPLILRVNEPSPLYGTLLLKSSAAGNLELALHLAINQQTWSVTQRLKPGELNYLDHPRYGLIIRAWLVDLTDVPEQP